MCSAGQREDAAVARIASAGQHGLPGLRHRLGAAVLLHATPTQMGLLTALFQNEVTQNRSLIYSLVEGDAVRLFVNEADASYRNTALGVRSIPQDYLNVSRVLGLSRWKAFWKVLAPATLPYVFTGYRLSLGIAWLVIVAAEMLTGAPGVGGFLWQEYNSLIYEHIIMCILTIGLVGYALDRLMNLVERRLKAV